MASLLTSGFTAADRLLQSLIGETAQIGGTNYTCTEAEEFSQDFNYEPGGGIPTYKGSIAVNKSDLSAEPQRGTLVTFPSGVGSRSYSYRITEVLDSGASNLWIINLVQLSA